MQSDMAVEILPASALLDQMSLQNGPLSPTHHFDFGSDDDEDELFKPDVPRAASYSDLPKLIEPNPDSGIKRTFSEAVLALPSEPAKGSKASTYFPHKELLRRSSYKSSSKAKSQSSVPPLPPTPIIHFQTAVLPPQAFKKDNEQSKPQLKSVSGTIKGFVKKSWMSPSKTSTTAEKEAKKLEKTRSKSPQKGKAVRSKEVGTVADAPSVSAPRLPSFPPSRTSSDELQEKTEDVHLTKKGTILSKGKRPLSVLMGGRPDSESTVRKSPSLRSLRSRASMEQLSSPAVPTVDVPPVPQGLLTEKAPKGSLDASKRKDPLWGVFRTLEGEYQKYQSKSSALKVNVIRSSLLPFLAKYSSHPSNMSLRVEDLDRRVSILNKWWTGLMEILNGRNNQSVSGTDRPVFLDAVTGIMTRSEWRLPPLTTPSNATDLAWTLRPVCVTLPARSTSSLESNGSDFLADSIYQNVRNIFVQNLLSQMIFVVDKMSMKTAPASLVTFCGKACAYAFFFCPGVADILTRLWTVTPESVRRILNELKVPRGTNLQSRSQEVGMFFPEAVRNLSFDSYAELCRKLRQHPSLPSGVSSIRWFGPWMNRWTGRESDLFFIFTKQFHILVSEFLPEELVMRERPCVPGLVLVHAQILAVLEATLYRQAQAGQEKLDHLSASLFDDIEGPDASAANIPLTAANAVRSMGENRLIMLLRELLSDRNPDHHHVRQLYAVSFDNIVKAAARRMSLYDNNACFVLCDFMEEVLVITFRYQQQSTEIELFDWPFWFEVCKKMMESHNSLTEVRTIAFVYSMWNILIDDSDRRRDLCLSWLLERTFFHRYFNHWSPMVRGYFYRLLCWRIARVDEEIMFDAQKILQVLLDRINEVWAQFLCLKQDAEQDCINPPSTAPCSPAPGRRLVILRTDSQPILSGLFMSLDNSNLHKGQNQSTAYQSHSTLRTTIPPADEPNIPSKRRWSVLKTMKQPFSSPGNARPGEVTPPGSSSEENTVAQQDIKASANKTPGQSQTDLSAVQHQVFSFKFSLEWLDRPNWPSRNRQLSPPKLPYPALAIIDTETSEQAGVNIEPMRPLHQEMASSKYSGRALAEWAQVVSECNSFFDRRKDEGVPTSKLVETPTLSVEKFRMLG